MMEKQAIEVKERSVYQTPVDERQNKCLLAMFIMYAEYKTCHDNNCFSNSSIKNCAKYEIEFCLLA